MKELMLTLLMLSGAVFAQQVKMEVDSLKIDEDSIRFELNIANYSNKAVVVYRPKADAICYNILKIKFRNVRTGVTHEVFPCKAILDLNALILNDDNRIHLEPGEGVVVPFSFFLKSVSPFLTKKESYAIVVELNFKDVAFQPMLKNMYEGNLTAVGFFKLHPKMF